MRFFQLRQIVFTSILVLIALTVVSCRESAQATPTPSASIQINLSYDPDPPTPGDGTIIVALTGSDGTPYTEAQRVAVRGDMTHAGMAPENGSVETGENGVYRVPFNWSMGGDWILTVTVTLAAGGQVSEEFEVSIE